MMSARYSIIITFAVSLLLCSNYSAASVIDIVEFTSFINATELGSGSLRDTQVGSGVNEFASSGIGISVTNSLGANNLGSLSIKLTNNTGSDLNNVKFFGFLDAQIDESTNSFFNELGDASSLLLGSGSADSLADYWEIDEPGFIFGDIYDHLLGGTLDNSNAFDIGIPDDVSLALGFDVGALLSTESLLASFEISATDNGGLYHYDPDSGTGFYFVGSVIKIIKDITIPEPGTLVLLGLGLLLLNTRVNKSGINKV